MSLTYYLVFLAMTTVVVTAVRWGVGMGMRTTHAERFEKQLGIPLPEAVRDELRRRLTQETRGTVVGTLLASALLVPVYVLDPSFAGSPNLVFYLIVPSVVSPAVAVAVVSVAEAVRQPAGPGPRLARSRTVAVGDYVPRLHRTLAWSGAVGAAATVTVVAVAGSALPRSALALAAGIAVLGVVVLGLVEVLGRALVRRPQPAHVPGELVMDDAVRGFVLQRMFQAPAEIGVWVLLPLLLSGGLGWLLAPLLTVGLVLALVRLVVTSRRDPAERTTSEQHFLRRLWSAPPTGQGTMAA